MTWKKQLPENSEEFDVDKQKWLGSPWSSRCWFFMVFPPVFIVSLCFFPHRPSRKFTLRPCHSAKMSFHSKLAKFSGSYSIHLPSFTRFFKPATAIIFHQRPHHHGLGMGIVQLLQHLAGHGQVPHLHRGAASGGVQRGAWEGAAALHRAAVVHLEKDRFLGQGSGDSWGFMGNWWWIYQDSRLFLGGLMRFFLGGYLVEARLKCGDRSVWWL